MSTLATWSRVFSRPDAAALAIIERHTDQFALIARKLYVVGAACTHWKIWGNFVNGVYQKSPDFFAKQQKGKKGTQREEGLKHKKGSKEKKEG